MTRLLFVCLGNICRSPAAEGVMAEIIEKRGLKEQMMCDSAGTSAYHVGSPADGRMFESAQQRGYHLKSLARQFVKEDFEKFDLILTMDSSNYEEVTALDPEGEFASRIRPFTEFCREHTVNAVPDPYYGGGDGFELVMDIVEDGCKGILESLINEGKVKV